MTLWPSLLLAALSLQSGAADSIRLLVRRLPEWQLDVLEGVGHVPMMEAPEQFLRALNPWLAYKIARTAAIS